MTEVRCPSCHAIVGELIDGSDYSIETDMATLLEAVVEVVLNPGPELPDEWTCPECGAVFDPQEHEAAS